MTSIVPTRRLAVIGMAAGWQGWVFLPQSGDAMTDWQQLQHDGAAEAARFEAILAAADPNADPQATIATLVAAARSLSRQVALYRRALDLVVAEKQERMLRLWQN